MYINISFGDISKVLQGEFPDLADKIQGIGMQEGKPTIYVNEALTSEENDRLLLAIAKKYLTVVVSEEILAQSKD